MEIAAQVDAAALAAVTSARPALRHVLFASEGQASVSSGTRFYVNPGMIDEHEGGRTSTDCLDEHGLTRSV